MWYACAGGAQEALTEHYNDQLRDLRAAGLAEEAGDFRNVLRQMRDGERAPLNHPQVFLKAVSAGWSACRLC